MNFVSFSLYGADPKYNVGALENARMVPEKYPGFKAIFFVETATVPRETVRKLRRLGARVHAGNHRWMTNQKLWRLTASMFREADTVLFRDADSRITRREVAAVREWLESSYAAHVMRDFPKHTDPVMGGMWGLKAKRYPENFLGHLWNLYVASVRDWDQPSDQVFLKRAVWPIIRDDVMQHDEFTGRPGTKQFPEPFDPAEGFVGEIFLEDGQGIQEHKDFRGTAPYGPK